MCAHLLVRLSLWEAFWFENIHSNLFIWWRINELLSVNERWQPKAEPDQVQKLGSDGKILSSHSQYEQRRVSRIEARKAELEKLQADHEAREKEKAERISRRRSER